MVFSEKCVLHSFPEASGHFVICDAAAQSEQKTCSVHLWVEYPALAVLCPRQATRWTFEALAGIDRVIDFERCNLESIVAGIFELVGPGDLEARDVRSRDGCQLTENDAPVCRSGRSGGQSRTSPIGRHLHGAQAGPPAGFRIMAQLHTKKPHSLSEPGAGSSEMESEDDGCDGSRPTRRPRQPSVDRRQDQGAVESPQRDA